MFHVFKIIIFLYFHYYYHHFIIIIIIIIIIFFYLFIYFFKLNSTLDTFADKSLPGKYYRNVDKSDY